MSESNPDLTYKVATAIGDDLLALLRRAVELAEAKGWRLYLVGGFLRDLLLEKPNLDVDLAVEGDAPALAFMLAQVAKLKVQTHEPFGTATVQLGPGLPYLDFVTARSETYPIPGSLPVVKAGTIADDLARRDFTINALALPVQTDGFGSLLDPHGGLADLNAQLVRALHRRSFRDDPTRIFRAVKLAVRLGFSIERETLELILLAVRDGALGTISTDRAVREIVLTMSEPQGSEILARLEELGVLRAVHPELGWPYPVGHPMTAGLDKLAPELRVRALLVLLAVEYATDPKAAAQLGRGLGLTAPQIRLMRDAAALAGKWEELGKADPAPSEIYALLRPLDESALEAYAALQALAADRLAWQRLHEYLDRLRFVRPELTGDYLKELGVEPGPHYKEALDQLLRAKLDGELPAREDEERFLREWLKRKGLWQES